MVAMLPAQFVNGSASKQGHVSALMARVQVVASAEDEA